MQYTESDLQLLAARVERLEARNRWWKLANILLLLAGVSLGLMGAKPADRVEPPIVRASTVEAQDFVLRDEAGHVYAQLSLIPMPRTTKQLNGRPYVIPSQPIPGQAALRFYDDKGEVVWTVPSSPAMVPMK